MAFVSEKRRNYGLSTSEKLKGEGSDDNEVRFTVVGDKGTATRRPLTFKSETERGQGDKDTIFVTGLRQLGAQWSGAGTNGKGSEQRDHEQALEHAESPRC
ncbi:hypothetical protein L804_01012 [Cryptococcus deuterogattii 2001/935-1]|nr:hypothetical protein L804_01012 [Cryptococcus deuterogattii 2001/935-1]